MRPVIKMLGIAGALVVVSAGAAFAGEYPPPDSSITVSSSDVTPGETITVSGTGCDPNPANEVGVFFDDVQIGATGVNPDGSFSTDVQIPSDATPGVHTITAIGIGCELSTEIVVIGEAGRLAFTGSSATMNMVWAGLVAATVGVVLVVAARRRASVGTTS